MDDKEDGATIFAAGTRARKQSKTSSGIYATLNSSNIYSGRVKAYQSAMVTATFLMDYENTCSPSLSSNIESIAPFMSAVTFQCLAKIMLATAALFYASCIEGDDFIRYHYKQKETQIVIIKGTRCTQGCILGN
eukprot:6980206-Ditylum_brightwellii.AAC.1